MKRILIAGMGNVLRGDDGFGVRVIERLTQCELPQGVELFEAGGAGIGLVQKLMDGYDACIIADAAPGGKAPGTVSTIVPAVPDNPRHIGLHDLNPARVLSMARALGALPANVLIVGCEPAETEELREHLSAPVQAAVEIAASMILREVSAWCA